jgi:hypothetical protein
MHPPILEVRCGVKSSQVRRQVASSQASVIGRDQKATSSNCRPCEGKGRFGLWGCWRVDSRRHGVFWGKEDAHEGRVVARAGVKQISVPTCGALRQRDRANARVPDLENGAFQRPTLFGSVIYRLSDERMSAVISRGRCRGARQRGHAGPKVTGKSHESTGGPRSQTP